MVYVALLRGINVGGNNKVEMARLKVLFESLGHLEVKTYINSGNVIFKSDLKDRKRIVKEIEKGIEQEFGFPIIVVIRDVKQIKAIVESIPEDWQNNTEMKCDVMFLWDEVDSPKTTQLLNPKPEIDQLKYESGAIIWQVARENINKSALLKIVGTPIYKQMTIRNSNTARKLLTLMSD